MADGYDSKGKMRPYTAGELASQAVKEVGSRLFGSGMAGRAADEIGSQRRVRRGEAAALGRMRDAQTTDRHN